MSDAMSTQAVPSGHALGRLDLINSVPDGIIITRADGDILLVNRELELLSGYEAAELVGQPVEVLIPSARRVAHRRRRSSLSAHQRPRAMGSDLVIELQRKDGTLVPVDVSLNFTPTHDGHLVVAAVRDDRDRRAAENRLRAAELMQLLAEHQHHEMADQLNAVFTSATSGMATMDLSGRFLQVNDALAALAGTDVVTLCGTDWQQLLPAGSEISTTVRRLVRTLTGRHHATPHHLEVELTTPDGELKTLVISGTLVRNTFGRPRYFFVQVQDATARSRAGALTVQQGRLMELIAGGAPLSRALDGIAEMVEAHWPRARCMISTVGDDGRLHLAAAPSAPPEARRELRHMRIGPGASPCGQAAASGRPVISTELLDPAGHDGPWPDLAAAGFRAVWAMPIVARSQQAVLGVLSVLQPSSRGPSGTDDHVLGAAVQLATLAIQRDGAERRRLHDSLHDQLTGLANRSLLFDRLVQRMARSGRDARQAVLLCLDIDRFQVINDGLGPAAGDELLRVLARRLRDTLAPGDSAARLSGDRFAVLLDHPRDVADAVQIAENLQAILGHPVHIDGTEEVSLSVSMGLHVVPASSDPADVLRDAETAMFRAKERGRRRIELFDREQRDRAASRLRTEGALRGAVRRGDLRLHYQPIIEMANLRLVGVEALIRWQHAERGLVGPDEFIPLAEEVGLIPEIGRWAMEQASRDCVAWPANETPISCSVNISGLQLVPGFADQVHALLRRSGLAPHRLVLEVTESALDEHADTEQLQQLRAAGVRIALDDFGTGYSSLSRLHLLPVDILKIDRSFVARLDSSDSHRRLVAGILSIARLLELNVVAEGIETVEHLTILREMGCDAGQGFFIGRPMPTDQLMALMKGGFHAPFH